MIDKGPHRRRSRCFDTSPFKWPTNDSNDNIGRNFLSAAPVSNVSINYWIVAPVKKNKQRPEQKAYIHYNIIQKGFQVRSEKKIFQTFYYDWARGVKTDAELFLLLRFYFRGRTKMKADLVGNSLKLRDESSYILVCLSSFLFCWPIFGIR